MIFPIGSGYIKEVILSACLGVCKREYFQSLCQRDHQKYVQVNMTWFYVQEHMSKDV